MDTLDRDVTGVDGAGAGARTLATRPLALGLFENETRQRLSRERERERTANVVGQIYRLTPGGRRGQWQGLG